MFRGLNQVSLDDKGRLAIPVRYRETLTNMSEGELVATVDLDRCLLLYPRSRWEEIESKLVDLPSLQSDTRAIQRMLLGYASDMQMDRHGRILLAPSLRDYAELDHKVVMIGQGNKFEIWSEERWARVEQQWSAGIGMSAKGSDALESISL
ncbi:MAG: division/cell wall cluster transcriptional repressor MraZ [Gammaproteobacteria bacterium]|nr:division/cell wall cluster transcriptional repressor MraZ [Gammaproteobacteria bacterium]